MQKGDVFLMGNPGGRTKHPWIILSDLSKHGGSGVIVNLTTDKDRSGTDCSLDVGDHPWITEESWVCFGDAQCLSPAKWHKISQGITSRIIVPQSALAETHLKKIISAAKVSKAFPAVCLKFLD